MRIAVNTRLLLPGRLEGIGWFTYETLKRITKAHPEVDFLFIFDRRPDPQFIFGSNVQTAVAKPQARHPLLWFLFFEFGVSRVLRRFDPDLFLSPDGWLSLRTEVPSLAVIHDLNWEVHPEFLPKLNVWYYRRFFPRFAQKARRIATVSEFTKAELNRLYKQPLDKIDVVYNGAGAGFAPLAIDEVAAVRSQFSGGKPYFLFVGLIHPRKNLLNQLKAFELFKLHTGSNLQFVVVGDTYEIEPALHDFLTHSSFAVEVHFLGRTDRDTLVRLYGAAFALSYVSHFEGFGIPLLEAMASDIPIITSDRTSLPEVCGDAGLKVDPDDPQAIAIAMETLEADPATYRQLVDAGKKRREAFSWERTANLLWASIEKALREK